MNVTGVPIAGEQGVFKNPQEIDEIKKSGISTRACNL